MGQLPLPLCLSFICINAVRCVCINTYVCVCIYVYICVCINVYACIHVLVHTQSQGKSVFVSVLCNRDETVPAFLFAWLTFVVLWPHDSPFLPSIFPSSFDSFLSKNKSSLPLLKSYLFYRLQPCLLLFGSFGLQTSAEEVI